MFMVLVFLNNYKGFINFMCVSILHPRASMCHVCVVPSCGLPAVIVTSGLQGMSAEVQEGA